jgi:allophanate hydrolase
MNLTIESIKNAYQSGDINPDTLILELRKKAEALNAVWIHLLSESELRPYLQALKEKSPAECPLWGVPFAIKDNIDLAGIPTTAACPEFAYTPEKSATVVELLIAAGAIPLGKTNLDQFATGLVGTRSPFGATPNAFNSEYISGGSSSGSAVATAKGVVSFALGTDTAGSGRVPACFNNLIGLKATKGLVSTSGVVPACRSLDVVSVFALTATDAKSVFSVAAQFDKADEFSRKNPVSNIGNVELANSFAFAVPQPEQLAFFGDSAYEAAFEESVAMLQSIGGKKVEVDFAPLLDAAKLLYEGPWVAERYVATKDLVDNNPSAMLDVIHTIISGGVKPSAADTFSALYKLQGIKQIADELVSGVDVLVTPTAGRHFKIEEINEQPIARNSNLGYYTNFMNLLDLAAIAVPTCFTQKQMPFGITLFSGAFSDQKLLTLSERVQQKTQLSLGATEYTYQASSSALAGSKGYIDVLVCGAHLSGMALNSQLLERGAWLKQTTKSAPKYRMYAVEGVVERPAMLRNEDNGVEFEVEIWSLPIAEFGSFVAGIAQPLGIGKVETSDGDWVTGFIAEGYAEKIGKDISEFQSWRKYKAA